MSLKIELSPTVSQLLTAQGLSQTEIEGLVENLLQLYLHQAELRTTLKLLAQPVKENGSAGPKAGSAKHLNIQMADDFDAPLEDFAEYM